MGERYKSPNIGENFQNDGKTVPSSPIVFPSHVEEINRQSSRKFYWTVRVPFLPVQSRPHLDFAGSRNTVDDLGTRPYKITVSNQGDERKIRIGIGCGSTTSTRTNLSKFLTDFRVWSPKPVERTTQEIKTLNPSMDQDKTRLGTQLLCLSSGRDPDPEMSS